MSDFGKGIALDASGNAYVTGDTTSTDFPTASPIQAVFGGTNDAFVTKLNAAGSALVYSTFLGGSGSDIEVSIAVDSFGNAYVTGYTDSTDFPTVSPFQSTIAVAEDVFIAKISDAITPATTTTGGLYLLHFPDHCIVPSQWGNR